MCSRILDQAMDRGGVQVVGSEKSKKALWKLRAFILPGILQNLPFFRFYGLVRFLTNSLETF